MYVEYLYAIHCNVYPPANTFTFYISIIVNAFNITNITLNAKASSIFKVIFSDKFIASLLSNYTVWHPVEKLFTEVSRGTVNISVAGYVAFRRRTNCVIAVNVLILKNSQYQSLLSKFYVVVGGDFKFSRAIRIADKGGRQNTESPFAGEDGMADVVVYQLYRKEVTFVVAALVTLVFLEFELLFQTQNRRRRNI